MKVLRIMETPAPLARPTKSKYPEMETWCLHLRCFSQRTWTLEGLSLVWQDVCGLGNQTALHSNPDSFTSWLSDLD